MRLNQLWLFPHPKPLVDRLGKEFFRRLPPRPSALPPSRSRSRDDPAPPGVGDQLWRRRLPSRERRGEGIAAGQARKHFDRGLRPLRRVGFETAQNDRFNRRTVH